jgi:CopG family nickel-responsive transcriptional regulator
MLQRFSISLDQELLADFDALILSRRDSNRSEAIRDLIRQAMVRREWTEDREVAGVITLVYDHHHNKLQERITDLQHDFLRQIISATHVHMDHHNCLEVIIVRGRAGQLQELTERLGALKGVKDTNLSMSSTGGDLR